MQVTQLIQAADRERQLQMQLDKMEDDISQLQKEFNDYNQRSAPLCEEEMRQRDMGRVIQTLPEGEPVVSVTTLDSHFYLLRRKPSKQIEVYDIDPYHLLRCLTVHGLDNARDIVACGHNRCAYICDVSHSSVH